MSVHISRVGMCCREESTGTPTVRVNSPTFFSADISANFWLVSACPRNSHLPEIITPRNIVSSLSKFQRFL